MPPAVIVSLTWKPGTTDQVQFSKRGRTFTVFLSDVHRLHVHSTDQLYLKGRVSLPVTRLHLSELMGEPRQQAASGAAERRALEIWANEGGHPEVEIHPESGRR